MIETFLARSRPWRLCLFAVALLAVGLLAAPWPAAAQSSSAAPGETPAGGAAVSPQEGDSAPSKLTDAQRIAGLQQLLRDDQQRMLQLENELDDMAVSFDDDSRALAQFSEQVTETKQQLAAATTADRKAELQAELTALQAKRKAAEESFNLNIVRRKALQAQVATLEEKIQLEKAALDELLGKTVDKPLRDPALPTTAPPQPAGTPETAAGTATASQTGNGATPAADATPNDSIDVVATFDSKVAAAQAEFTARLTALRRAEEQADRIRRGIEIFEQDLANEKQLLSTARQQRAMATDEQKQLAAELAGLDEDDAEARQKKQNQLEQAEAQAAQAKSDIDDRAARIASLQQQLKMLANEQQLVVEQLETLQEEAEQAGAKLRWAKSPFAPHRVSQWFLDRAPKILALLAILFGFWWLLRFLARRMIRGVARRTRGGTAEEREERAQTLVSVVNSVTTIAVLVIGLLAVLDQAGVDVTVLMGGAAALGVAIGFGAQNLMRDYFYGVMVLAENQYRVGNWVKIADITGMVENITLRITVLRDLEGIVHFIPHSQITTVSNLTHGWSRAVFEVGVAYKEDVDRVMEVLMDLASEMRHENEYRYLILEDPEMLGVDALGDSAVVIKFIMKTRPLKQWTVRRELLRRIKNRFDELGIEIPFPHRTIYHRDLPAPADQAAASSNDHA